MYNRSRPARPVLSHRHKICPKGYKERKRIVRFRTLGFVAHDSMSYVVVVECDIVAEHWVVVALDMVHCSA